MAVRFTIGRGAHQVRFVRAPQHTAAWDRQKGGFRLHLNMPAHGQGKA